MCLHATMMTAAVLALGSGGQDEPQRYSQYIDPESGVVTKPEGYDDPYGDGVWRSSWFYASLAIIRAKEPATYERLKREHGVSTEQGEKFLKYFRDNCIKADEWKVPKNDSQKFSGDQLAPLLYFLAAANSYGTEGLKATAKDVLEKLVDIDKRKEAVSDSRPGGHINPDMRFIIDTVCRMYDVSYKPKWQTPMYEHTFTIAMNANNLAAQAPDPKIATKNDYAVFNALGLVSVTCLKWGKDNGSVRKWRDNYKLHADKGWGPAYRIISGRSISNADIEDYSSAHTTKDWDNDIILAQRARDYLSSKFGPSLKGGPGQQLALDYVVLKGLQLVWQ